MTALGTESTIAIQAELPSEQLTMTQQRGTERWIDRARRFGSDRHSQKDFQKCHFLSTEAWKSKEQWFQKDFWNSLEIWGSALETTKNFSLWQNWRACLGNCGKKILIMQNYRRKTFPTLNAAMKTYVSGAGHPCLPCTRPLAAEIDTEQCVFITMTTKPPYWRNKA